MWLDKTMGIEGIPIPYGAPCANARLEKFDLSLRVEALDHFIFFCEKHIYRVCKKYILIILITGDLRKRGMLFPILILN